MKENYYYYFVFLMKLYIINYLGTYMPFWKFSKMKSICKHKRWMDSEVRATMISPYSSLFLLLISHTFYASPQ